VVHHWPSGHWVIAEQGEDLFAEPDGRHGFVAVPAVVDLAKDAQVGGGLGLSLAVQEAVLPQVCAKNSGYWEEISALSMALHKRFLMGVCFRGPALARGAWLM